MRSNSFSLPRRWQLDQAETQGQALAGIYILFGLVMGSWASRIPSLQAGLGISHSMFSFVLLCGGLGALLSFPLASHWMAERGARDSALLGSVALTGVLVAIGMASSLPMLMLTVLMLGMMCGCFGVGLNAVSARYEKAAGASRMARLHALGSVGSLAGSLLGSLLAGMGIRPATHFVMVAVPAALLLWLCFQMIEADNAGEIIQKKVFALPRGPLLALGVLGFCGAMAENSIADWSGVFMKQHFGVSDGFAPLALSAFTTMMMLARLAGDKLKEKHGAARLMTGGALVAACGLLSAITVPHAILAVAGFAMAGAGLAFLAPFIVSASGGKGPMASASVGTMSNIGSLTGPPVIGGIAGHLGMSSAIGFIGLLTVVIAFTASRTRLLQQP